MAAWLYCPRCGRSVSFGKSLQQDLVRVAIQLQIQRIGTQIQCRNCRSSFVLREMPWGDPSPGSENLDDEESRQATSSPSDLEEFIDSAELDDED
ncbi:hypothetical protein GC163_14960 [bacterium]|nr:hypothetical protein [bacterium]